MREAAASCLEGMGADAALALAPLLRSADAALAALAAEVLVRIGGRGAVEAEAVAAVFAAEVPANEVPIAKDCEL